MEVGAVVVLESSQDFGKDIGWKKGGGGVVRFLTLSSV